MIDINAKGDEGLAGVDVLAEKFINKFVDVMKVKDIMILRMALGEYLNGAVVSTSDYESAGPSSIPDKDSQHTDHQAAHPS